MLSSITRLDGWLAPVKASVDETVLFDRLITLMLPGVSVPAHEGLPSHITYSLPSFSTMVFGTSPTGMLAATVLDEALMTVTELP